MVSRSVVVLICAFREAFCEDLAAEALSHLADQASNGAALPDEVKKTLKKGLLDEKHELAIWDVADDGWRATLRARASSLSNCPGRTMTN